MNMLLALFVMLCVLDFVVGLILFANKIMPFFNTITKKIIRDVTWGRITTELVAYPWFGQTIIIPRGWMGALMKSWEPQSFSYLSEHVKNGDNVVDVGACFGLYTVAFSRLVGTDGHVYAFEPDPYMFRLLQENIKRLHLTNVISFNIALGENNRVTKFYVTDGGMSSLEPMVGLRSIIDVRVRTLDTFEFPRIDWMKIDTEGTEHLILQGAKDTLHRCNPKMLIEFLPQFGHSSELLHALEGWKITGLDNNILCEPNTYS